MKKMMLLAATVALAALMLAAAPAFAQPNVIEIDGFRFSPGNCGNLEGRTLSADAAQALIEAAGLDPDPLPDAGNVCLLDEPGPGPGPGPGPDGDGQNRDRDRDRDGFFDFDEPFISQDIEQEAESGDIDQSFDVSQTGDNSNQTVGIQGTANTGNAQNVIDVVDAGDFGDFNHNNDNDNFVICDFDNDGDDDECEDFNHNNDGFVFCDRDRDGKDDGDDDCFVVFPDFNDGFFDDGFFVNGDDDGDIEIEDSGATIELSPTNTTNSHQEVNQAAAASAPQWVWTASGWRLV